MRIGYRRLSGPVGLSPNETGTRGMWWEKRIALLTALRDRGHEVLLFSRLTKPSEGAFHASSPLAPVDLLLVEFGGTNSVFFGKDLDLTYEVIRRHRGSVVYLCDDPDLWFPWKALPKEDWTRWRVWANCTSPAIAGLPQGVHLHDFPFSALQKPLNEPTDVIGGSLAYIGRPQGRSASFQALFQAKIPLQVYGREAEWKGAAPSVLAPPPQPRRAAFYASQLGCLAVADRKHKQLGWRTGRAFHAILAGCPAVSERDHGALKDCTLQYGSPEELLAHVQALRDPAFRAAEAKRQLLAVLGELPRVHAAFREVNL